MKVFFAGYILLLLGVFFLWGIEPLHRAHNASSSPAQTPTSALAAATSSLKRALAASPIISSAEKKQATTREAAGSSALSALPSTTSTPPDTSHAPELTATPSTTASTQTATATPIEAPAQATTTPPTQQELITQEIETGIHQKINAERAKAGLPALSLNAELSSLARAHSADMLSNNYFAHDNASGCSSSCRLTNAGFLWNMSGENIYVMSGYAIAVDRVVEMAIESWMGSAGHRENILNPDFTEEGIGIAYEGTRLYATEDFAQPR